MRSPGERRPQKHPTEPSRDSVELAEQLHTDHDCASTHNTTGSPGVAFFGGGDKKTGWPVGGDARDER